MSEDFNAPILIQLQRALKKGDILVNKDGTRFEFLRLVSCRWIDKCHGCDGQIKYRVVGTENTSYDCFGNTVNGRQYSHLKFCDLSSNWIDDADWKI